MSKEYIDREDVLRKMRNWNTKERLVNCVEDAPAADVVPKREIAREIFEEIDRMCIDTFGNFNHRVFTELKKKYTKE